MSAHVLQFLWDWFWTIIIGLGLIMAVYWAIAFIVWLTKQLERWIRQLGEGQPKPLIRPLHVEVRRLPPGPCDVCGEPLEHEDWVSVHEQQFHMTAHVPCTQALKRRLETVPHDGR